MRPAFLVFVLGLGSPAQSITIRVPAQANPYLAGMPAGARVGYGDSAPAQSPILVNLPLSGAAAVSFSASGAAFHGAETCPPVCDPPDGGGGFTVHEDGPENGISNITAPYDSLIGVFLEDGRPDRNKAPKHLDFNKLGLKFTSLAPELRQVFFIGTGATKDGTTRRYLVPKGATRLYLGMMDGHQWNNNSGSFVVAVAVERVDVSSTMFSVDSNIAYAKWSCMPNRRQCTPEKEIVEAKAPGVYHVVLPAQLEWGASISTPPGSSVTVSAVKGTVCLDFVGRGAESCHDALGEGNPAGEGYLVPHEPAGSLVTKTADGRTYFSVNDRPGAFETHQGYFEFDVIVR